MVATWGPGQAGAIRQGSAGIREASRPEDHHPRLPLQAARTWQSGAGKSNGNGHGDSDHAAGTWVARGRAHGVEGGVAGCRCEGDRKCAKTRAERATEQATKKEREARE